jgi:hypothetical protein
MKSKNLSPDSILELKPNSLQELYSLFVVKGPYREIFFIFAMVSFLFALESGLLFSKKYHQIIRP